MSVITRAISLRQPWAWLVASGHKDFENRTQKICGPGTYWLHASLKLSLQLYCDAAKQAAEVDPAIEQKLPLLEEFTTGGIIGWMTLGAWQQEPSASLWSRGSGYPITAAGTVPFHLCPGRLGSFIPEGELPPELRDFNPYY